jgi:hypothetical protein
MAISKGLQVAGCTYAASHLAQTIFSKNADLFFTITTPFKQSDIDYLLR